MHVTVTINLSGDDAVPTATPADVLTALGGDPEKDSISVSVSAGHAPPPPPPEPIGDLGEGAPPLPLK